MTRVLEKFLRGRTGAKVHALQMVSFNLIPCPPSLPYEALGVARIILRTAFSGSCIQLWSLVGWELPGRAFGLLNTTWMPLPLKRALIRSVSCCKLIVSKVWLSWRLRHLILQAQVCLNGGTLQWRAQRYIETYFYSRMHNWWALGLLMPICLIFTLISALWR